MTVKILHNFLFPQLGEGFVRQIRQKSGGVLQVITTLQTYIHIQDSYVFRQPWVSKFLAQTEGKTANSNNLLKQAV